MIDYVPTNRELEIIQAMRRDIQWNERKLQESREALEKYEKAIRSKG